MVAGTGELVLSDWGNELGGEGGLLSHIILLPPHHPISYPYPPPAPLLSAFTSPRDYLSTLFVAYIKLGHLVNELCPLPITVWGKKHINAAENTDRRLSSQSACPCRRNPLLLFRSFRVLCIPGKPEHWTINMKQQPQLQPGQKAATLSCPWTVSGRKQHHQLLFTVQ